jgi:hypothetical protein
MYEFPVIFAPSLPRDVTAPPSLSTGCAGQSRSVLPSSSGSRAQFTAAMQFVDGVDQIGPRMFGFSFQLRKRLGLGFGCHGMLQGSRKLSLGQATSEHL